MGAVGVGFAAPIADLAGLAVTRPLDQPVLHMIGSVLAMAGFAGAFGAQLAMGSSWGVGWIGRSERPWSPPARSASCAIPSTPALPSSRRGWC